MIEKLFTSKNRIKLLTFFLIDKKEGSMREISRQINISVSAVKKEVDNLAYLGILNKSRNNFKENIKCPFIEDLRNILLKTDYFYIPLKESLNKEKIQFALIFGSFAGGGFSNESDIDLFVVGKIKLSEVYNLLKEAEKKTKREVNPIVWTIENLKKEKNGGFIRDIFKKKIIMLKGDENEIREIVK